MRVEQYKILAFNRKKREIAKANRIAEPKKKKEEREKKALEVNHITQALKAEFGEEVKFSMSKVRELLIKRGVSRSLVGKVKRSTVVQQWEELQKNIN